jgi:hypothetical protein
VEDSRGDRGVFTNNLYVLDSETGQLWKHESNDGVQFRQAIGYLTTPLAPNTARAMAIDGDVWIVTSAGDVQRFRRNALVTTAARIDFVPRWEGTAPAREWDPGHRCAALDLHTRLRRQACGPAHSRGP